MSPRATPAQKARRRELPGAEKPEPTGPLKNKLFGPVGISVLLAISVLAAYGAVPWNGFVDYDDADYVTANPHVLGGLTWANVVWAFRSGHASNWHPLTWLSHMLDCELFGPNPGPQHLVNLAFHVTNTVLLFLLLRRLTGAHWRSALVAGLFGLHPLHVESVAWISERKDVLSTFFGLLCLWAYGNYAKKAPPAPRSTEGSATCATGVGWAAHRGAPLPGLLPIGRGEGEPSGAYGRSSTLHARRWYGLSLALFALGLMSKPMLVTIPFLLILLDYWPLGRFGMVAANGPRPPAAGSKGGTTGEPAALWSWPRHGQPLWEKSPFFLLAAASCVVTFLVQKRGGAVSAGLSLGARWANAVVSYVRYARKTLWPSDLSVLYPHPGHWPAWEVAGSLVVLAVITGWVLWVRRTRPYATVGWLWFLGTLVPVIGLVQVGIQSMADRYAYVPSIGLFLLIVWLLGDASEHWRRGVPAMGSEPVNRQPGLVTRIGKQFPLLLWMRGQGRGGPLSRNFCVAVLVLGACGWLTFRQVEFWHDSETLFRRAVQVTHNNYLAYNNLGFYLSKQGKLDRAMENYQKSLAINPSYEDALNNMGYALAGQKKYAQAISFYQAALRVRPNHPEVHNNLGNALSEIGKLDEAIAHYEITLRQNPEHADAQNNLGIALAMEGKLAEAIPHFQAAIRFKPNYASAHSNLGNALAAEHQFDAAIAEYQESLRLNPDDAQAHNNLANVLAEKGLLDAAVANYTEALRLNTNNPEAHFNLGCVLDKQGKHSEAVTHYREALRLKPDYEAAKKQLEQ